MSETSEERGLTLQGMTFPNTFHIIISVCMVAVSAYLTHYFFETHFPTGIGSVGSLCDLGQFWNCGGATFSAISNIYGVPISFFGIIIGFSNIVGTIFPSEKMEKTLAFISTLNIIGCIGLFIFSIIGLGSLCPLCTVYYILSLGSFLLFLKYGRKELSPSLTHLGLIGLFTFIGAFAFGQHYQEKEKKQKKVLVQIVKQYFDLKNYGDPNQESPYKLVKTDKAFADHPIRISIFSDFQCPFCKMVNEQFSKLEHQYKDKIAVQYLFFPLDSECNINVRNRMHPYACKAAYLAACSPDKFKEVHDEIFANQRVIDKDFLQGLEEKYQLEGCMENPEIKKKVVNIIAESMKYNIQSTPSLIINGRKIEGSVPSDQMRAILNAIIKEERSLNEAN